ncbi:MAG: 50S ribosomal protein L15 [Planctomycetaceae bacterium]|nr:50S ribosomal protein L15 [Planctomycetaceae bacterium]
MRLNDVNRGISKNKKRKRIGRGPGSGHGKTSGRGHKGQGSRAGHSLLPIFEGGRMPLVRRIPKRGFNNKFALTVSVVNVSDLENAFSAGDDVTPETLQEKSLAKSRYDILKILGDGELTKKLKVSAHRFSTSAREKIEKVGGEIVILAGRTPVEEKKKQKKAQASS